jgi:large subunit ribosomal protein L21
MYAIIATGGKQYRVSQGDVIYIERLNQEVDSSVNFDVLLLGSEAGVTAGTPVVMGASVEGKVVAQLKGEKITIRTYRSKKASARKMGHRQPYTKVEITSIKA